MLSKIHLQNYKKFQDVDVTLSPFTILMGENSSGKTSILQAINLALRIIHDRDLVIKKSGIIQAAPNGVVYFLEQLPAVNISKLGELFYGGKVSKTAVQIDLIDQANNIYQLQITSRFGSFNFKCISSLEDLQANPTLHLFQPLLISGFVGLNATEERKFPKAIQDRVQTGRMSEIIRNLVLDIKGQPGGETYEQLSGVLDHYFNFHIDTIKFDQEQDLHITTSFSETRNRQHVSLDLISSGSGLLQVLQILAPIYRFASKGTVVLLDEPDAHLHTNLQYTLAQALREVQMQLDIQIIISTHSIPMIEAAEPSEIVPVYAQTRHLEPLVDRLHVNEAISNLIDNYHLAKAKISGKILFIEDAKIDILRGFDRILQIGCIIGINTLPVVPGDGKDNKDPFRSKKILKEYTGRDIEIHFMVDGDAMPLKWREHFTNFAQGKLILHQLRRHEIENYFLIPELLIRALKKKYPRREQEVPSAEELQSCLIEIMKQTIRDPREYFKDHIKPRLEQLIALNKQVKERILDKEAGQEKEITITYDRDMIEREARRIADSYYDYDTFEQLVCVAPGKEVLSKLNKWLDSNRKMSLGIKDIASCLLPKDVPDEIEQVLKQLGSGSSISFKNTQQ